MLWLTRDYSRHEPISIPGIFQTASKWITRFQRLAVGDREGLSDTREGSLGSESAHTYVLSEFSTLLR